MGSVFVPGKLAEAWRKRKECGIMPYAVGMSAKGLYPRKVCMQIYRILS